MTKTSLNFKERLFCVIAYLPKATVQAAIGSVPLSMGLACGQIVLSVAVLAILITAPLGAIGIDRTYKKLLVREKQVHFGMSPAGDQNEAAVGRCGARFGSRRSRRRRLPGTREIKRPPGQKNRYAHRQRCGV